MGIPMDIMDGADPAMPIPLTDGLYSDEGFRCASSVCFSFPPGRDMVKNGSSSSS